MRNWRQKPLQREYLSELDRCLINFDKRPEASSVSRRAEEAEYAKIAWLRDYANDKNPRNKLWEKY